ncbi:hypothetical protein KIPB_012679 [Kipferlia bialata]|uniref:Uncharacterized protein n=1 Tax=Kipferlia bialata TaxID=797122 RepID=A0A9K3D7W3_9EUKA|nr:hypothetical protein KIPB_012679 [Kipferlia bialata]|eukprot:g12679.t1
MEAGAPVAGAGVPPIPVTPAVGVAAGVVAVRPELGNTPALLGLATPAQDPTAAQRAAASPTRAREEPELTDFERLPKTTTQKQGTTHTHLPFIPQEQSEDGETLANRSFSSLVYIRFPRSYVRDVCEETCQRTDIKETLLKVVFAAALHTGFRLHAQWKKSLVIKTTTGEQCRDIEEVTGKELASTLRKVHKGTKKVGVVIRTVPAPAVAGPAEAVAPMVFYSDLAGVIIKLKRYQEGLYPGAEPSFWLHFAQHVHSAQTLAQRPFTDQELSMVMPDPASKAQYQTHLDIQRQREMGGVRGREDMKRRCCKFEELVTPEEALLLHNTLQAKRRRDEGLDDMPPIRPPHLSIDSIIQGVRNVPDSEHATPEDYISNLGSSSYPVVLSQDNDTSFNDSFTM